MIRKEETDRKHYTKFLGVTIDQHLNWKKHIESTKNKISKTLYCIRMVKNTLPKVNLKTLYITLIQPHLDYGITLWGSTHEKHLNRLIVTQKKTIRNLDIYIQTKRRQTYVSSNKR